MNRKSLGLNAVARGAAACVASLSCLLALPAHAGFGDNLIVNPGAESAAGGDGSYASNLPGWDVSGELTAIAYDQGCSGGYLCSSDPLPAAPGANQFGGGYAALSTGTQQIDLGFAQSALSGAGAYFALSGWLGGYASQNDHAALSVVFRDAAGQALASASVGPVLAAERADATALLLREQTGWVPLGAVSADVSLVMTRTGGSANDGYADNLSLVLQQANVSLSSAGSARVGELLQVQVAVNTPFAGSYSGDELLAFGFDLGYDSSLLRLSGVTMADGWNDDSALLSEVDVAGSAFPGVADSAQDALQLATLSFEVLAEGSAWVEVRSAHGSNLNQGLTYALGDSVDLYGRTTLALQPVPEPASWALMLGGGIGLVGWLQGRRARRAA